MSPRHSGDDSDEGKSEHGGRRRGEAEPSEERTRPPGRASGLSELIREHREQVLAAWEQAVRALPVARDLDRPTLMDHIPLVLDRIAGLADEIGSGGTPQLPEDVAEIHAVDRLGEGFDLGQVVMELNILRDCIMGLWQENLRDPAHLTELRVLHQAIDKAVTASIDRYTKARDRTIQAMDRIANAVLESRTLDSFLHRLLGVLVETTAAIDTATILLREGDILHTRASIGLEEEVRQKATQRIGEGFAGRIAATLQPLELSDARTDPIIARPAIRAAGIRALYGVPLVTGGEVIAVAHMGSLTAHEFSRQDKQLFLAMANRASTAIYQHVLWDQVARTAAELHERELEFRTLADNIPQLAWMTDAEGRAYWFNRRWLDYTGLTLEQSLDGHATHHPDHQQRVAETWRRAISNGSPWEDIVPLLGRDGRYRWFLSRAIPIPDETGRIVRWFGTNTDVTNQRFLDEATKVLHSSLNYADTLEQLARLAVPDMADWCLVDLVEPDGVRRVATAHWDPAKLAIADAWAQKHPTDWSKPTGVPSVIRTGKSVLASEITEEVIAAVTRDEEHRRDFMALGVTSYLTVPLLARGRTLGAITLVATESGRHYQQGDVEVAEELGRRAGMAVDNAWLYGESQQAIRTREEVLAVVSHDLRSPLGVIDLSALNLLHAHGDVPRSRKQLEVIRRSAERMTRLIHDLLDMATIEAKGLSLSLAPHDAVVLVESIVDLYEPLTSERGLKLTCDLELTGVQLWCDRNRIEQVFANLLDNAKKYCRPGDEIFVRGALAGGTVQFSVADTGPGIAPEEMPHLFQPFWAAKRHAVRKGTGLGLHICKGIVEAHGGRMWAESRVGQGATFVFTLPLMRQAAR